MMCVYFSSRFQFQRSYLTTVAVEGNDLAVTLNWQPPQKPNGQITGKSGDITLTTLLSEFNSYSL